MNPETAYETFCIAQQTGCSAPVLNRLLKSLPENIQYCIKIPRSVSPVFVYHSHNINFFIQNYFCRHLQYQTIVKIILISIN